MNIYAFVLAGTASWFVPSDFSPAIKTSSPYVCAMNPPVHPGTKVVVYNSSNGKSSHCLITGSGPGYGRAIDVSPAVRDELGFTGLANVKIYKVAGRLKTCRPNPQPLSCKPPVTAEFCVINLPAKALVTCSGKRT